MGLFDKVEKVLSEQVADLQARLQASETAREQERARNQEREEKFFATEQDLIHTICLLKGIPIMEHDEHGNAVEVQTVPSVQRRTWTAIIAGRELESRRRADESRRQQEELTKRKTRGVP
jgi:hypothetical protein